MKNLLALFYWLFHDNSGDYKYKLPKDGFKGKLPLQLHHTIIPDGYVNHNMEEDKQYYSSNL